MRLVSLMGVGLLVGAALIIIIPEGIHMYLAALKAAPQHGSHRSTRHTPRSSHCRTRARARRGLVAMHSATTDSCAEHAHEDSMWPVGASIAVGFALMLVVDRISEGYGHAHAAPASTDLPTQQAPHRSRARARAGQS